MTNVTDNNASIIQTLDNASTLTLSDGGVDPDSLLLTGSTGTLYINTNGPSFSNGELTVNTTGVYMVTIGASQATADTWMGLYVNGTVNTSQTIVNTDVTSTMLIASRIVSLNAGDVLTVRCVRGPCDIETTSPNEEAVVGVLNVVQLN